MHLSARNVAALVLPGDKNDEIHFDDTIAGFGYRLRRRSADAPTRGSWVVQYRRGGATRRVKIGDAGVVSAEAAREAAKKELARVTLGGDPQGDRRDRRERDRYTLRSIIDAEYLPAKKPLVRIATFREIERYLTGKYFRELHGMAIDKIERRDVARSLASIIRTSGSVTAVRARSALSSFFAWGMQMGLAEANPVIGSIQPEDSKGRTRVLANGELAAVWNACANDDFGKIIRLLILTGCRRQEIGGMRWSELDVEAGTWTLPGERSKNGKAHTLPLPQAAWGIVNTVPRMAGRDPLFGVRAAGYTGWDQVKPGFDRKLGAAVAAWNIHDLRRSVATGMAEHIGIQPHVIEALLNHVSGHKAGVAGIYNRASYAREVKAALATWADYVCVLAEGSERKVLPFVSVPAT
jgi:integrase